MTEQEKREKVIKGLECCCDVQSGWKDARYVCPACPYTDNGSPCETLSPLMEDALSLLKAQEPRVMTVADIVDNYVAPEVVWVEARNNKGDIRLVAGLWNGEYYNMADDSVMYDLGEEIANNPEGYNTRWRCWTSRPDENKRVETPWG